MIRILRSQFPVLINVDATVDLDADTKLGDRVDDYYVCMICTTDIVWNA
jgi:hypothetical protein